MCVDFDHYYRQLLGCNKKKGVVREVKQLRFIFLHPCYNYFVHIAGSIKKEQGQCKRMVAHGAQSMIVRTARECGAVK